MCCPPCTGMVVARPSGCCQRSWLRVYRVLRNPSFRATLRNSSARAPGMGDFGGIGRQRLIALRVFLRDHLEYGCQFKQRSLSRRHQRMATRNGWNFGDPTIRFIPEEHDFIVIQAYCPILIVTLADGRRVCPRLMRKCLGPENGAPKSHSEVLPGTCPIAAKRSDDDT